MVVVKVDKVVVVVVDVKMTAQRAKEERDGAFI